MPRKGCGKRDGNPKKQCEITGNAGRFEANDWRINQPLRLQGRIVKVLKQNYLFSQTFSLDTASPRS
jgi:hypothetical protein